MKSFNQHLAQIVLTILINCGCLIPGQLQASEDTGNTNAVVSPKPEIVDSANNLLQEMALKVLILNAVIGAETSDLLEIPDEIRDRWDSIRLTTVGFLQIAALGTGTFYLGKSSLDEFRSILAPINFLVKQLAHIVELSAKQLWASSEKIGVDVLLRSSGESFEAVANMLATLFASSINKGVMISSAFITASGVFSSSVGAWSVNTNEVLTYEQARRLLGYDKELQKKIDRLNYSAARLLNLDGQQAAQLKSIIENEVIRVGIEKEFATDQDYRINLIPPMLAAGLINSKTAAAINGLNEIYLLATQNKQEASPTPTLTDSVNILVALSAILDAQLAQENLDRNLEKEIRQQLADVQKTLKLVTATLQ